VLVLISLFGLISTLGGVWGAASQALVSPYVQQQLPSAGEGEAGPRISGEAASKAMTGSAVGLWGLTVAQLLSLAFALAGGASGSRGEREDLDLRRRTLRDRVEPRPPVPTPTPT
jgi:hypothetical protein